MFSYSFVENLLAGIVGAIILWTYAQLMVTTRSYLYKRKYRVQGEYISYFVDTQDGQRVISVATAKIKQTGRKIQGTSDLLPYSPGKERNWTISGEIIQDHYILGNYVCTTPLQTGMGTFTLRMVDMNRLEGHWSGYDSDNLTMNHGEYIFKRIANIKIEPYSSRYLHQVIRIEAETLGAGYITSELKAVDISDKSRIAYIAKDIKTDEICGIAIGHCIRNQRFEEAVPRLNEIAIPPDVLHASATDRLAILSVLAVAKAYQGRGVGTKLARAMEKALSSAGAEIVIALAWELDSKVFVHSVLATGQYTKIGAIPKYWKSECDAQHFSCPERGESCRCGVVIYRKYLNQ